MSSITDESDLNMDPVLANPSEESDLMKGLSNFDTNAK